MKTSTILLITAAGFVGAGYFLYKRGRETHQAVAIDGTVKDTVRAGALSIWTELKESVPTSPTAAPVTQTVSTAGTRRDTGVPSLQTVPTHDTYRMTQLVAPREVITTADLTAQGIAR